jgi:hypothetical protein
MVHGYKFSPSLPQFDPHRHILSLDPDRASRKAVSWPTALGATPDGAGAAEPLCLAIGWEARRSPWQAYRMAAAAGAPLAALVNALHAIRPDLRIGALAHSMGARVVLSTLAQAQAGALSRAVLMAPAEMGRVAARFLDTPGGRAADILCVTTRENAVFEQLLGWTVGPHRVFDRAIGHRSRGLHPRLTHLRLHDPDACAVLAAMGYPLAPAMARVCHWSVYLRDGLFPLYRAVLTGRLPVAALRAALPAQAVQYPPDPIAETLPFGPSCALPFAAKTSSS